MDGLPIDVIATDRDERFLELLNCRIGSIFKLYIIDLANADIKDSQMVIAKIRNQIDIALEFLKNSVEDSERRTAIADLQGWFDEKFVDNKPFAELARLLDDTLMRFIIHPCFGALFVVLPHLPHWKSASNAVSYFHNNLQQNEALYYLYFARRHQYEKVIFRRLADARKQPVNGMSIIKKYIPWVCAIAIGLVFGTRLYGTWQTMPRRW